MRFPPAHPSCRRKKSGRRRAAAWQNRTCLRRFAFPADCDEGHSACPYNKDMQEDKDPFFDARDTLLKSLPVFTAMLRTMTFREDIMAAGAAGGFTNATDCADYLVKKGVAFRDAHRVVGELVAYCIKANAALTDLSLSELKVFHPAFEQDVYDAMSLKACVGGRSIPGGPAPAAVQVSIDEAREQLKAASIA